ncbi:MAG: hypothetical protein J6U68_01965 [Clostridia bacterium]|nr:hypothetical protein [Clostridia bacterium]
MKDKLTLIKDSISEETVLLSRQIVSHTDEFLSSFNKNELLSFSNTQSKTKEYEEKYFLFVSGISSLISALSSLNADLASLLIEADRCMEIELIVICEKRFNAFEAFEHALYDYTSSVENEIINSKITAQFLISATQKFKFAINELIKVNL